MPELYFSLKTLHKLWVLLARVWVLNSAVCPHEILNASESTRHCDC